VKNFGNHLVVRIPALPVRLVMGRLTITLKKAAKNQEISPRLQFFLYGVEEIGQTPHIT
jgi:hypothetical protein